MKQEKTKKPVFVPKFPLGDFLDITRCGELKFTFDNQHSDGVVPDSNETDLDITKERGVDKT
jgi:hypothetical protein